MKMPVKLQRGHPIIIGKNNITIAALINFDLRYLTLNYILIFSLTYNSFQSMFLCKLTTHIIIHEISTWSFSNSKIYISFNRGIRSSFETYRQHF